MLASLYMFSHWCLGNMMKRVNVAPVSPAEFTEVYYTQRHVK
jgi:hypothetical protein